MYSDDVWLQSAIFFETPEEIFARVFSELKPRTSVPALKVEFRKFANANSSIRWDDGGMKVRITDVLEGAPAHILEALANILLSKLLRRPGSQDPRGALPPLFQSQRDAPQPAIGEADARAEVRIRTARSDYNLEAMFEDLNARYFGGMMARPLLGWSRRPSRTMLGHYDPSHNAIILSRLLDSPAAASLAVEYVLFHEMLHLRYPVEHRGARRCVHTPDFKAAEKQFAGCREAKELLKKICR